ncbi:MAG TPA: hypothetical protein VJG90_06920 [Candidatus Nanoarchaeia archaeon]|nr:hypothetical protein [Candidatus Nanoarchaeia archaeon]
MTPTKDIQLETVGQVVDYLRTKEGLEVITDEELPRQISKYYIDYNIDNGCYCATGLGTVRFGLPILPVDSDTREAIIDGQINLSVAKVRKTPLLGTIVQRLSQTPANLCWWVNIEDPIQENVADDIFSIESDKGIITWKIPNKYRIGRPQGMCSGSEQRPGTIPPPRRYIEGATPLNYKGIDALCEASNTYNQMLSRTEIIQLRDRHAFLLRESRRLDREANALSYEVRKYIEKALVPQP